jgi:hypothetical protein
MRGMKFVIDTLPRVNSWDSAINDNSQQAGLTLSTARVGAPTQFYVSFL